MGQIQVNNLGKAYKQYPGRWARLAEWLTPGNAVRHQLKWVLQDITFNIQPGEAVGIIGINGAGKSTLLKLITGTAQPTTGHVSISGQVAALLELGMGFHPDFTGRQNAIMAGQLLGMTAQEVTDLMPQIEAFAEIGEYIDSPVRVYSSGMQMRLAFSVATVKRPDVLIVDEALSVGDAYFQHKSFDRIRQFQKAGTTLLIVSHDKAAIQSICDQAILLKAGRLVMQGKPEAVMDYYNAISAAHQQQEISQFILANGSIQTVSGNGQASIESALLTDTTDQKIEIIEVGSTVRLVVEVWAQSDLPELVVGFMIKDRLGQPVFGTNSHHCRQPLAQIKKGERIRYLFEFNANIGPGHYTIALALHTKDTHLENNYEWRDQALLFEVVNNQQDEFVGTAWLKPSLKIHL
jgi:lipopolysaccharide transport system ATP-binding protein